MSHPRPLSPRDATEWCRAALHKNLKLAKTRHALDQMLDRDLIDADVIHLLGYGYIYDDPKPATRLGYFKYAIQGSTPNSAGRDIRAIIIPDFNQIEVKVVTVMWGDEPCVYG